MDQTGCHHETLVSKYTTTSQDGQSLSSHRQKVETMHTIHEATPPTIAPDLISERSELPLVTSTKRIWYIHRDTIYRACAYSNDQLSEIISHMLQTYRA